MEVCGADPSAGSGGIPGGVGLLSSYQPLRARLRMGFEKGWVTREEMEGRGGAPPGERRHPPVDDSDLEVGG
jgi:hypothetical protein